MASLSVELKTSPKIDHSLFGISRFTYPARNGSFLSLIGEYLQPKKIALLGSGPIEPFETAFLPIFLNSQVFAFDNNKLVIDAIRKCIKNGNLKIDYLAELCRSEDSENLYFKDLDYLNRQLNKVNSKNSTMCIYSKNETEKWVYFHSSDKRISPINCDLRYEIPEELSTANLVFEGFMLINWEKEAQDLSTVSNFLKKLFIKIPKNSWFASATSISHILALLPNSVNIIQQVIEAGRIPFAGSLRKWSVAPNRNAVTQFSTVFRSETIFNKSMKDFGLALEIQAIAELKKIGISNFQSDVVSLRDLPSLLQSGDILSFREFQPFQYYIHRIDWASLSNHCLQNLIRFEY